MYMHHILVSESLTLQILFYWSCLLIEWRSGKSRQPETRLCSSLTEATTNKNEPIYIDLNSVPAQETQSLMSV